MSTDPDDEARRHATHPHHHPRPNRGHRRGRGHGGDRRRRDDVVHAHQLPGSSPARPPDTHGPLPAPGTEVDAAVIPTGAELIDAARTMAKALRAAGVRTTTPLDLRKPGKEIQRAAKAGARVVVIIGSEDWSAGEVTVRDLINGDQQKVPLGTTSSVVTELLGGKT